MSGPLDPRQRFTSRVDDYAKYRPSYPPEVVDLLRDEMQRHPGDSIADIGSGTGIFSRWLLDQGYDVFAVEPNAAMRQRAELELRSHDRFHSIAGTAEQTSLKDESVDAIVCAQAFHWFDPQLSCREFARILRPPRWVIIVWNDRRVTGTPFLDDYERLLRNLGIDYEQVALRTALATDSLTTFFDEGGFTLREYPSRQELDHTGFIGRAMSSSYVPGPDHPHHAKMLEELNHLFDRHQQNGFVTIEYITKAYFGTLRTDTEDSGVPNP